MELENIKDELFLYLNDAISEYIGKYDLMLGNISNELDKKYNEGYNILAESVFEQLKESLAPRSMGCGVMSVYDYGYALMQVTMIVNDWEFESDEGMYSTIRHILKEHNKIDDGSTSWLDNINEFIRDNKATLKAYKESDVE